MAFIIPSNSYRKLMYSYLMKPAFTGRCTTRRIHDDFAQILVANAGIEAYDILYSYTAKGHTWTLIPNYKGGALLPVRADNYMSLIPQEYHSQIWKTLNDDPILSQLYLLPKELLWATVYMSLVNKKHPPLDKDMLDLHGDHKKFCRFLDEATGDRCVYYRMLPMYGEIKHKCYNCGKIMDFGEDSFLTSHFCSMQHEGALYNVNVELKLPRCAACARRVDGMSSRRPSGTLDGLTRTFSQMGLIGWLLILLIVKPIRYLSNQADESRSQADDAQGSAPEPDWDYKDHEVTRAFRDHGFDREIDGHWAIMERADIEARLADIGSRFGYWLDPQLYPNEPADILSKQNA